MRIGAVVLAAGDSRRFGSDKRFFLLHGVPMLTRTLAVYRGVFDEVAAVVRPGEREAAALVETAGCRVVAAPDAARGQSRSLAAGVAAMRTCDGLVIGLGDMPLVQPATLRVLASALAATPSCIVRPCHQGQPGNPIAFPAALFDELCAVCGDRGAKHIVARHAGTRLVAVEDAGILRDFDRPPAPDEEMENTWQP